MSKQTQDELTSSADYKLVRKATGFTVTQQNRAAYVLQLQALLVEQHGAAANDLPEGESGIEGCAARARAPAPPQQRAPAPTAHHSGAPHAPHRCSCAARSRGLKKRKTSGHTSISKLPSLSAQTPQLDWQLECGM